jgi:hypothetical protein
MQTAIGLLEWDIRSLQSLYYLFRIFLMLQSDQKLSLFYCCDFIIDMAMSEAVSCWAVNNEA